METRQSRRAEEGFGFWWNIVHIFQGIVVLSLLWNLIADAVNSLALSFGRSQILPMGGPRLEGIRLCRVVIGEDGQIIGGEGPLPPELCYVLGVCIFVGFVTWAVFKLVCWTEWVKEEITWEECWKDKKWYNPWHWVTTLVCVTKKAVQWVLKTICKYLTWVVVAAVFVCIIALVVAAL